MNALGTAATRLLPGLLIALLANAACGRAQDCYAPPTGLVSWWAAEWDASDVIGPNSGILQDGVTFTNGRVGFAFSFDGANDSVEVPDSPPLNIESSAGFSIEAWVQPFFSFTSYGVMTIVDKRLSSGTHGYEFPLIDGQVACRLSDAPGSDGVGFGPAGPDLRDGNFHHVALCVNRAAADGGKLYVDGDEVLTFDPTQVSGSLSNNQPFRVGRHSTGLNTYFKGAIDELSFYDRALSGEEIRAIFNAGSLGKCNPSPESPKIVFQPVDRTVALGSDTSFIVGATGGQPLHYQWRSNGTDLAGETNHFLKLTNVRPSQAGVYSVLVTNALGAELSSNATLKVRVVTVLGNGQPLTSAQYTYGAAVTIQLQNAFAGGLICYTTDGSEPSFASTLYTGPFVVSNTVTLRAIGYSLDFWESGQTDPIVIAVLPTYTLTATTPGGGSVARNPSASSYVSNSVVTLTATPASGWAFLQWTGDATGGNPTTEIVMNGNKSAQAVFGTALGTTVAGNGAVAASPALPLYPFGAVVQLTALPQPGSYFGLWGNAAGGTTNPLYFVVTNSGRTVSSIFGAVGSGQAALTVVPVGKGRVNVSPRTNVCNVGQALTLTAVPNAGRTFLRWSGDTAGTANPLSLTMNQSKVIYAHFTGAPEPAVQPGADGLQPGGFQFRVTADLGDRYQIEGSTNLMNWDALATLTNYAPGPSPLLDVAATNSPRRFYRAVLLP